MGTIWAGRPGCYYCTFYIVNHQAKFKPKKKFVDNMGVIKQMKQVGLPTGMSSAELSGATTTDDESVTSGQHTPVPEPSNKPKGLCANLLRRSLGHRLQMKRGRRTQQRCENERMLMAMYGIDSEGGEDIPQQGKSYFLDLLQQDNEELLEQFINNEEPKYFNKEKRSRRKRAEVECEEFEPEEAFLKIGSNLRQALKHQLPLGMLEGIEERLHDTFSTNPNTEYVVEDLSSFERLLLHATCAYYALNSHSFDFGGRRMVRVENPWGMYKGRDPRLADYLVMRSRGSA